MKKSWAVLARSSSRTGASLPTRGRVAAVMALAALSWGFAAGESADAEIVLSADVGFEGFLPPGLPAPVTIRIENRSSSRFEGEVSLHPSHRFGAGFQWIGRPVEVAAGAALQFSFLVEGRDGLSASLRVESGESVEYRVAAAGAEAGEVTAGRQIEIPLGRARVIRTERAILVLGPKGKRAVEGIPRRDGYSDATWLALGDEPVSLLSLAADRAPDSVLAYAGVDEVFWTDPDLAAMQNPRQAQALLDWVRGGGRLTILGLTARSFESESEWLQQTPLREIQIDTASYPDPNLAGGRNLDLTGPVWAGSLVAGSAARPLERSFLVDSEADGLPGPVVYPVGFGELAVARFDPFVYDLGTSGVFAEALGAACGTPLQYVGRVRRGGHRRYDPGAQISGPLGASPFRDALENENTMTPSFPLFFLLALAFVILIGPLDFGILKRRGKLHWSPWTLLAYTVVFSAGSIGATFVVFAPNEEVNRIAYLNFTEDGSGEAQVAGVLYHGVYSPISGDFTPRMREVQCFGFAVRSTSEWSLLRPSLDPSRAQQFLGPGAQPLDLPLSFNSARVAAHLVSGPANGRLIATMEDDDGADTAVVFNGLDRALIDAMLVSKRGVIEVGEIGSGETARIKLDRAAWISRRQVIGSQEMNELPGADAEGPLPTQLARAWMLDQIDDPDSPRSIALSYDRGDTVLMAQTDRLPFDDGLSDRRPGFSWIFVRKVVGR